MIIADFKAFRNVVLYNELMQKRRSKEEIEAAIAGYETAMASPDFWSDKDHAQRILAEYQHAKDELAGVGKYDKGPAILSVLAGAGGDDAEDWAAMLVRMYQKFCESRGWPMQLLSANENEQGGYRNATFLINAKNTYGTLKHEGGVHRLVRISPFNANDKRQTSFALVEVLPELPDNEGVLLDERDLEIEFTRSGGKGGQNVNKVETAVRVTQKPTGFAVRSDGERSQEANKRRALELLRGKLFKLEEEAREKEIDAMTLAKTTKIEWGNQIRSYVVHPYKMVKDHRTGVETSNTEAVLERGDIQMFIDAMQSR